MEEQKSDPSESFKSRLKNICAGLFFLSETDSDVLPVFGKKSKSLATPDMLEAIGVSSASKVEQTAYEKFFDHLTTEKEWFDTRQKNNASGYRKLNDLLQSALSELKVFRIGKTRLTIYVIGLDKDGYVLGIELHAVET